MRPPPRYDPGILEPRWQERWREGDLHRARRGTGRKFYCYNPAPYVTGHLHMGHVRNYTYGDFRSRYERMRGSSVLYTIGFDAFGVPTETAAARNRIDPAAWTVRCIAEMKRQMDRLGFGFDWSRSFCTSDPGYYRWTQWIFLEMLRDGLVYRRDAGTIWCPRCETALARAQAAGDRCFLCGTNIEVRTTSQWFLRISGYLDRLRADLGRVRDLNGQAISGQESLLAAIPKLAVVLHDEATGARFSACLDSREDWQRELVLAIHPEDVDSLRKLGIEPGESRAVARAGPVRPSTAGEDLVPTSARLVEPGTGRKIPVVLAPSLDPLYLDRPFLMPLAESPGDATPRAEPPGGFRPVLVSRQKDFSISRHRLWGTPVPVLLCGACGPQPMRPDDLPLLLPAIRVEAGGKLSRDDRPDGGRPCPRCGGPALPEPQVLDCHFDALWHICRPCTPDRGDFPFGGEEFRYWMPVDQIQFGRDTIPFLLTMRLFVKFLEDRGLCDVSEFARETLAHGLILKDNAKMSKHLGNVVDPEGLIARYGADTLRFFLLARSDPKSDYSWSDGIIARYHALLREFHEDTVASVGREETEGERDGAVGGRTEGRGRAKHLRIFLAKALRELSVLESSVERGRFDTYAKAVARLLAALRLFRTRHGALSEPRAAEAWRRCHLLATIALGPIAPHLAEECWEMTGHRSSLFAGGRWPEDGPSEVRELLRQIEEGASGGSRSRAHATA